MNYLTLNKTPGTLNFYICITIYSPFHFRKPEYNMASEIPLNLFCCEYEDIKWHYDDESLSQVIDKLNTIWTYSAAK